MRKILIVLLISLSFSCADDRPLSGELTDFLPNNSAVILQMNDPDLFFSNLQNNEFLKLNQDHQLVKEISSKLAVLDFFPHKSEALLTLVKENNSTIEFSFISRGIITPSSLDSIPNRKVETLTSKDLEITKYVLEGKTAFSAHVDSITIISSSKKVLENSILNTYTVSPDLKRAFTAASPKKTSVFINHERAAPIFENIFPENFKDFSHWTVLDASISQSRINFDGISIPADTLSQHLRLFSNAGVAQNRLAEISPVNSRDFTSISFRDFDRLHENLRSIQNNSEADTSSEVALLQNASEAGIITLPEGKVFAIQIIDPEAARLSMDFELQESERHREAAIYEWPGTTAFGEIFPPLLRPEDLQHFSFLNNWIIFAGDPEPLKQVITAVQDELVLANAEAYKNSSENLSSEASILIVKNNQASTAEDSTSPDGFNYKDFPITAIQFILQDEYAHVHSVLAKNTAMKSRKATSQTAAVELGAALGSHPVFFRNHRTKGMDVAVQDVENTLHLISPEGKIYWKKKLEGRILGEIQTVDILRNGRYQLAFATPNELHVIDRDGNPVKPFPLKFRDPITQSLAIFDYDNNRDYRFVITQGRELLMYDRRGKSVKGFTFSKTGSEIVQPPKHIRIGRKDYILVPEDSGKLNILSRTGKIRVPVKENLEFSENEWYEYNGNFVSTNNSGQILKLSEEGKVKRENLDLSGNTRITATPKTLVTLSENHLSIGGNSVTLDFGLYTNPQIFYLNNKIYVSVTDLQAHRVYLFDSNGSLLSGFPVYGNSLIDLANADKDEALELVVQGEDDGVLVYEIN